MTNRRRTFPELPEGAYYTLVAQYPVPDHPAGLSAFILQGERGAPFAFLSPQVSFEGPKPGTPAPVVPAYVQVVTRIADEQTLVRANGFGLPFVSARSDVTMSLPEGWIEANRVEHSRDTSAAV